MVGFGKVDKVVEAMAASTEATQEMVASLAEAVAQLAAAVQALTEAQKIPGAPPADPAQSTSAPEAWVAAEIRRLRSLGKPSGPDVVARLTERSVYLDTF